MTPFDVILVADWSSAASPSPARPSADAIWIGEWHPGGEVRSSYHRTRAEAEAGIRQRLDHEVAGGRRVLFGLDFAFGYPAGFAAALTGHAHAFAVWDWLEAEIRDGPDNANNRFEVADRINARFPGVGPFWGRPEGQDYLHLPAQDVREGHGLPLRRPTEDAAEGQPKSVFQIAYRGAVGGQTLVGMPMLARLRRRYEGRLGVWPFEDHALDRQIVLAEVYPSLIPVTPGEGEVRDDLQVRTLAAALGRLQRDGYLAAVFAAARGEALHEEGWILGVGVEATLKAAGPRSRNDCFALPPGIEWTPVDVALGRLRDALGCVTSVEEVAVADAAGRVLAEDAVALRSNPPAANAAVDGYAFRHEAVEPASIPLAPGRAAAGAPFEGVVPEGQAVRILTGALVPEGADTVLLQEDARVADGAIEVEGVPKKGANIRRAGEDVAAGDVVLSAGRVLGPPDLALLAAVGIGRVAARRRLRVGVLSTGDEIADPGAPAPAERTYDANRPMLLAVVRRWGHAAHDLGRVADDRDALRARLDAATGEVDAVLTSGGASGGDEDHVSALLGERGALSTWRIAIKPGRPLVLGHWHDVPVFGLPGNPVAALVTTLIFARPALSVLSGAGWVAPVGFQVPAAFEKRKKAGRRELLRARLGPDGRAEVFRSEGSGRISGLSWADGLVELPDEALHVRPGDPVRYLPWSSFGL